VHLVLGSLMREYHDFGALPLHFPIRPTRGCWTSHQMYGQNYPSNNPKGSGKAALAVTYVSFCIFNPKRVVCRVLHASSFLKHKLHHQASVNRITIALSLRHRGYYIGPIRIAKLSLVLTMYYIATLANTMSHLCHEVKKSISPIFKILGN